MEPDELRLDDVHRYWLGDRELLGTTRLLKQVGLVDSEWFTDEGRLRGQYVHEAIQLDLEHDLGSVDPGILGYVDAARAFLRDAGAEVVAVERLLADPMLGIGGRPDLIGRCFGHVTIVDWKCGTPARWHRYQSATYKHLVLVNKVVPDPLIDAYAVYLDDKGHYTVGPTVTREDWKIAQAAIIVAQAQGIEVKP
jgi:hypothetical protein